MNVDDSERGNHLIPPRESLDVYNQLVKESLQYVRQ